MTSNSGAAEMCGGAKRRTRRRRLRLISAATIMSAGLTACGDLGGGDADVQSSTPAETREPILIKTRFVEFDGEVLPSSTIGDSPFCSGGTFRHEGGSPTIGFPAVNVFTCADGELRIGFGPGPDQQNNAVQTSNWKILDGTGRFAGMSGEGEMKVRFAKAGAVKGEETFRGQVMVP